MTDRSPVRSAVEKSQSMPAVPPPTEAMREDARRSEPSSRAMQAPLGTGHGRNEASYATRVAFERASSTPTETLAVRYDRRETLAALGVLPRDPYYARRAPEPFPGAMRFVPDPR